MKVPRFFFLFRCHASESWHLAGREACIYKCRTNVREIPAFAGMTFFLVAAAQKQARKILRP
jgi:hypothetical protein